MTFAPFKLNASSNRMAIHLPNREELLFLIVLALPNDSKMQFDDINLWQTPAPDPPAPSINSVRICFVVSVFPAPDSPEVIID